MKDSTFKLSMKIKVKAETPYYLQKFADYFTERMNKRITIDDVIDIVACKLDNEEIEEMMKDKTRLNNILEDI